MEPTQPAPTTEASPQSTDHGTPTAPPPTQPAYPLTVTDDDGTETVIESEPQTIVSLTPANTELVFALGAGDRLRGGTDFDDYPAEAAALPDVVVGIEVQTEQIVDIAPDLVLAGGNNFTPPDDVARLRDLGMDVLVVYPETFDEIYRDITLIGVAIGRAAEADAIVDDIAARVNEVLAFTSNIAEPPRTLYEIGYGPDIYGPAKDSFIEDMVRIAGGDPITSTDPAVFSIPLERLVDIDPEIIILGDAAYGTCPDSVLDRPGWEGMTAVQESAIRPVDDIVVTRPGPRSGEGLAALALAIHPDADIDPPTAGAELCVGTEASPSP